MIIDYQKDFLYLFQDYLMARENGSNTLFLENNYLFGERTYFPENKLVSVGESPDLLPGTKEQVFSKIFWAAASENYRFLFLSSTFTIHFSND